MMPLGEDEGGPRRVIVAGDWHANTRHAVRVIGAAGRILYGEPEPLIIHLGDFGVWPGRDDYLAGVRQACGRQGVKAWFVDGNHEWHPRLSELLDGDPVRWLPRGTRWNWHGRAWLALGGAASVDRALKEPVGRWWPEEEITGRQAADAVAGGPAHVMVTHDAPAGVPYSLPPPPPAWDLADLARSGRHRERLQGVVDQVRPGWLAHGHLHLASQRLTEFGYGSCEVTGLDRDGGRGPNWAVLDVKTMTWGETG
jgi:hypothetical protein